MLTGGQHYGAMTSSHGKLHNEHSKTELHLNSEGEGGAERYTPQQFICHSKTTTNNDVDANNNVTTITGRQNATVVTTRAGD